MSSDSATNRRRYPGLKPFERDQSALFYGRGEDVQRLGNLILRERLTVLFAKSGIGKTSLLQAGVAPELEKKGFLPIFLRADKTDRPLTETVRAVLRNHPNVGNTDTTDLDSNAEPELWELIKRLEFDLDGLPVTPVLVFDQFEEVFTLGHTNDSRTAFVRSLADLVNESMPEAIRARLLARVKNGMGDQDMAWWEREPDVRIVVSIRSDFLHLLDEISPDIPGILRNRYQLQPLGRKQAEDAIQAPASAAGDYASPRFAYSEAALSEIVNFLAGRQQDDENASVAALRHREEIESFNLQILCRHIEEEIIRQNKAEGYLVEPAFYGGQQGMADEIRDFYKNQLAGLPAAYTRRTGRPVDDPEDLILTARRLIEESLVTPIGRRCSMVDDFLTSTWSVSQEFLDTLVDSRILRKDLRLDDFYYEISHDTLLPAILESRELRRKQEKADEEKARLENELREEALRRQAAEQELAAVEEKRSLAKKVSILSLVSLLLTLGFGIWFMWNWFNSIMGELNHAERNFRHEVFEAAIPVYDSLAARPIKKYVLKNWAYKDVRFQSAEARRFQQLHDAVQDWRDQGDSLFFKDNYAEALDAYRQAADSLRQYRLINYRTEVVRGDTLWRIEPRLIYEKENTLNLRITSTRKTLIDQFKIRQRDAETFIEAGVWAQALRNLRLMEKLMPKHPEDVQELQTALNLVGQTPEAYVAQEIRKCRAHLGK